MSRWFHRRQRDDVSRPVNAAFISSYAPADVHGPSGYTAGWKAMPGSANPSQQIGAFDGMMLNQYPAYNAGVQLHQGREFGSSRWYVPSVRPIPNGDVQKTTRPNNVYGGVRAGNGYTGPLGPVNTRVMQANLTAQQVRQSGLAQMQWAQGLSAIQ